MRSDGYQTFNYQQRDAFSAKYQYQRERQHVADRVHVDHATCTATRRTRRAPTRAQIAQFGDNFLMTDDPASPLYYKYNFYHIPTDFEYVGVRTTARPRLVDRRQDLHDAVLQQAELQRHHDHLDDQRAPTS